MRSDDPGTPRELTPADERRVLAMASVPEHLVGLMTCVSGGMPALLDDHLVYVGRREPVGGPEGR